MESSRCLQLPVYLVMEVEIENTTQVQAVLLCGTRWNKSGASMGACFQVFACLLVGLGKRFSQQGLLLVQMSASSGSRSETRSRTSQHPVTLATKPAMDKQPAFYISFN